MVGMVRMEKSFVNCYCNIYVQGNGHIGTIIVILKPSCTKNEYLLNLIKANKSNVDTKQEQRVL